MAGDSSISGFDNLQRDDVLELLAQCIAQLPRTQKTVLALYYHEDLEPAEIAACLDLTECEIEQIRAETLELLQSTLGGQIGLPELPDSLEQPRDADGTRFLVNGH
jgi:DNA-directed RNA polymerase specialized sigma subunit